MSDRWQRLLADFETAAALDGDEQKSFLEARRREDPESAAELERMLRADTGSGPLDGDSKKLLAEAGLPLDVTAGSASLTGVAPTLGGFPPPAPVAAVPSVIGRYQVLERIGRGGFGDVFRGFDPVLKRAVAIKTCLAVEPAVKQRFVREAELAARLLHPNIVTVHDFGADGEVPYLVQELLPGEDLAQRLQRGGELALADKLRLLLDVAAGLAHAHAAGIVHRDVKPGNLRLLPDGRVKILDFGIARELGAGSVLTGDDRAIGTLAYMAPEQARGEQPDARADVHGWGAVAYELLSGRRAVPGDSPAALIFRLLDSSPTPLGQVAPDCPPELAALVDRCLDRDPAARLRDGAELLATLEPMARRLVPAAELAAVVAPWAVRQAPARSRRGAWVAGIAALVVVAIVAWVGLRGRQGIETTLDAPGAAQGSASTPAAPAGTAAAGGPVSASSVAPATATADPGAIAAGSPPPPPGLAAATSPEINSTLAVPSPAVPAAPPPTPTGVLQVDARPWGELVRLVAADGHELPLPDDAITPLALTLPAGHYTAWLRNPHSAGERSCEADVEGGGRALCRVELRGLRASDLLGGPAS